MKSLIRLAVLTALVAMPASAGIFEVPLKGVGCFPDGTCFLLLVSPLNESGCSWKDQVRFTVNAATPGSTEMYRTALSAYLAGRKVSVAVDETGACHGNYPKALYLFVE